MWSGQSTEQWPPLSRTTERLRGGGVGETGFFFFSTVNSKRLAQLAQLAYYWHVSTVTVDRTKRKRLGFIVCLSLPVENYCRSDKLIQHLMANSAQTPPRPCSVTADQLGCVM